MSGGLEHYNEIPPERDHMAKQEKISKLAHWLGWHPWHPHDVAMWLNDKDEKVADRNWNPFTLDAQGLWAARMLEDEVERRGLQEEYFDMMCDLTTEFIRPSNPLFMFTVIHATPALKSEAVWRMIGGE